jgi:hypothetical protein
VLGREWSLETEICGPEPRAVSSYQKSDCSGALPIKAT